MHRTFSKFAIVGAAFAVIIGITVLITGQPASKLTVQPASQHRVGIVDDWSFHHLVFSNSGTYEQVAKDPAAYAKWLTIRYDTRFIMQQMKRHPEDAVSPSGMVEREDLVIGGLRQLPGEAMFRLRPKPRPIPRPQKGLNGLWSEGILTGTVQPSTYPAKYGAIPTLPSCYDYVVYPTGTAGSSTAASIVAYWYIYSACIARGAFPSVLWAYDTGGTVSTSPIISLDGSQAAFIQVSGTTASLVLLKPFFTIQGNASDGSTDLAITSGTVTSTQAGEGLQISGPQLAPGTLIMGLSADGVTLSQGAQGATSSQTYVITVPGTVSVPGVVTSTPYSVSNSAYYGCTVPCMTTLAFSNSNNDTYSAPFYDYNDDILYVGDDSGNLHQFTGVFNGTPAETVTTGPNAWPVTLNASYKATSPVYDPVSGYVFVGNTDAVLYAVGTGTGTPTTTSGKINAYSASLGDVIIDGPMVDPSAGTVYVFVTTNTDTSSPSNAVFQFSTSFSGSGTSYGNGSGDYGTEIGTGGTGFYLYAGAFDNAYLVSTPSSPSGNLWVAGNTGTAGGATLYQVPIVSNAMQSPVTAVTGLSTTDYAYPTPLTEFCNNGTTGCSVAGGTDYLFFSVYGSTLSANSTNCGASGLLGCVLGYNITTTTPSLAGVLPIKAVPTSLGTGCWATGGIVIDNAYSAAEYGSSQVYFIDLGGNEAGGPTSGTYTSSKCATGSGNTIYAAQASQSKLQ